MSSFQVKAAVLAFAAAAILSAGCRAGVRTPSPSAGSRHSFRPGGYELARPRRLWQKRL